LLYYFIFLQKLLCFELNPSAYEKRWIFAHMHLEKIGNQTELDLVRFRDPIPAAQTVLSGTLKQQEF
jgi:hypothetical protein